MLTNNTYLNARLRFIIQKIDRKLELGDTTRDYPKIKEIFMKITDPSNTIEFQEFKEIRHEIFPNIYRFFSLNFHNSEKDNLINFLKEYINIFNSNDLLKKPGENFYNFKKNKEKISKLFQSYLKDYAIAENPIFDINPYYRFGKPIEKEFRFYDLIFYLIFDDAISINDCDFVEFDGEKKLSINVTSKKNLSELILEENAWKSYKNIKINEITGEVIYNNSSYPFKPYSRPYKVLFNLINSKGNKLNIYELYDNKISSNEKINLKSESEIMKYKKEKIKQYIKVINKRLHFSIINNQSIGIHIIDRDYVILKLN